MAKRDCKFIDVSDSGAQLSVASLAGLQEFLLLFTSIGLLTGVEEIATECQRNKPKSKSFEAAAMV